MPSPLGDQTLQAALDRLDRAGAGCGCQGDLTDLLRDDAALYRGRGAMEVERLRGYILARLAVMGVGEKLRPYIVEELETGTNAAAVAGAARAARHLPGMAQVGAGRLLASIERMRNADDFVDLEVCPARLGEGSTTCVSELILSLAEAGADGLDALKMLRSRADTGPYLSRFALQTLEGISEVPLPRGDRDVAATGPDRSQERHGSLAEIAGFEVETEAGEISTLGRLCDGHPALLAFFYTRCLSPDKCSRTISQLAKINAIIRESEPDSAIFVGAISYDPDFDAAARLMRYGSDRRFQFGPRAHLLRTTGGFAALRDTLMLSVGYGPSTVNRHRLELVIIAADGAMSWLNGNRLWDEAWMASELMKIERSAQSHDLPLQTL